MQHPAIPPVVLPDANRVEGLQRQLSILYAEAEKLRDEARKLPAGRAVVLWEQHDETCRQMNAIAHRLIMELHRAVFPPDEFPPDEDEARH